MTDRTIDIKQPIDRNIHITMHIEYNMNKMDIRWTARCTEPQIKTTDRKTDRKIEQDRTIDKMIEPLIEQNKYKHYRMIDRTIKRMVEPYRTTAQQKKKIDINIDGSIERTEGTDRTTKEQTGQQNNRQQHRQNDRTTYIDRIVEQKNNRTIQKNRTRDITMIV